MRALRWTAWILAALVAIPVGLAALAAAAVAVIFATAQTDTGGEVRAPGLDARVSVVRDANAVPHIFADSRHDAYRALGFVHAQDRFFQMEFARRTAAGRLSEAIGPSGLRSDRFMRTLGVYASAEASVERMSPEARAAVEAYAEGINAWIAAPGTRRPPEMIVLGMPLEPWRPADSLAWVRLMALLLSGDFRDELLRAELAGTLTPEQMQDLWPGEPAGAPATLAAADTLRRLAGAIPDMFPAGSASNEWVVSGARSASGKPLLANDPHLGFGAPGMWHLARIVTPDFTASGAALPGQPFFVIGQNGHLAWGLTTTHADTQDLFVERMPDGGRGGEAADFYEGPHGAWRFETRTEEIRVRWRSEPERLTVRTTRHGPVVTDILERGRDAGGGGARMPIALAFPAIRGDDRTADAVFGMNSARTVPEFLDALRLFHAPVQNVAYAHTDGSFGFVTAGRLPIRPGGPGTRPVPGWTGEHDWQGFVPFEDMPQLHSPANGLIVNANNRVVARGYPHVISNDWPEGYRARRILDLLGPVRLHTPEGFAAVQNDTVSLGARELLDAMIATLPAAERSRATVEMMTRWNGAMDRARPEPLIFAAWAREVRRRILDDELGERRSRFRGLRPRVLVRVLARRQAWCDDRETEGVETCAAIVAAALDAAEAGLRDAYGNDPAAWRWGDAHRASFAHPLLRFVPPLAALVAPRIETDGGDYTVNRGTYADAGGGRFPHVHGAGLRAVFDMADPHAARYIVAPGQSGHIASPHYGDLAAAWRDGRHIVLNGDEEELRRTATSELTLLP